MATSVTEQALLTYKPATSSSKILLMSTGEQSKGNKSSNLIHAHPNKHIRTPIGLAVAMSKLNLAKPEHQFPAIIQNKRNNITLLV